MTIVFNNPHGAPVSVNIEDTVVVDKTAEGTTYATQTDTGTLMTTVMSDGHHHDPMGIVGDMEQMGVDSQLNDMEDAEFDNPPKRLFTSKNLRLQTAISGQQAFSERAFGRVASSVASGVARPVIAVKNFVLRQIPASQSIRDSPILFLTTAKDWHQYVDNINTVDIGAEFAAGVSSAQRASCALFQAEWEADPAHSQLQSRLLPAADISDAVAKGQLAYDLMVRGREILGKKGYGQDNQSVMFRLVYDIVRSMPMKSYNYYTLYQLHPDEGDEIYSEFQSRYVPLDTYEVEMVRESKATLVV